MQEDKAYVMAHHVNLVQTSLKDWLDMNIHTIIMGFDMRKPVFGVGDQALKLYNFLHAQLNSMKFQLLIKS